MSTEKRAALYVRVSTDRQTVENQVRELTAIAERRGWKIVETYQDAGISGVKGRDQRPDFDRMLNAASKHKFDVVLTWALDRLGRSTIDVLTTAKHLKDCGVALYIEKFLGDQCVDTSTPAGELIYTIFAGIAAFERGMMIQRVKAGVARAKANGTKSGKPFGRPALPPMVTDKITAAIAQGNESLRAIAARFDVSEGTVRNIRDRAGA